MHTKLLKLLLFASMLIILTISYSQNSPVAKYHFSGTASITNNGISVIPTFSLGKPASIFNMSVGDKKLSFEPEFRFSLEGKPWSFLFWWRYKMINNSKFHFTLGGHPALAFKTTTADINGIPTQIIQAQRYLAAELTPTYTISKNMSIGMYYLYSRGLEPEATRNTHFLTINSTFPNIPIAGPLYLRFNPQFYYLKMDQNDGFYFTSSITLADRKLPLSISSAMNKIIKTNINASQNFVWNLTLTYSFNHQYDRLK